MELGLPESVAAAPIREEAAYPGTRVTLEARLENARIRVQVDIGFGDVVTPAPEEITFPALLDFPAPQGVPVALVRRDGGGEGPRAQQQDSERVHVLGPQQATAPAERSSGRARPRVGALPRQRRSARSYST